MGWSLRLWLGVVTTCVVLTLSHGAVVRNVWIDCDLSAGVDDEVRDVDDAYAVLHLMGSDDINVAGVSTVFGNALIGASHEATAALLRTRGFYGVYRGAGDPSDRNTTAVSALVDALESRPLTIVALGALTNVAAALALRRARGPGREQGASLSLQRVSLAMECVTERVHSSRTQREMISRPKR